MKPVKVIVNPTAGKGAAEKAVPQVQKMLNVLSVPFEMVKTQAPGHGIELACKAAEKGAETVVAMGGDGTVNEVITGLMQNKIKSKYAPSLAVFTVGRGNDFAYGVSIPHNLKANCEMLLSGTCHTIDIGRVSIDGSKEIRYFGNGIGIGFDAVVGFEAQKLKISGFPAYAIAALKTMFLYFKAPTVEITLDNERLTQPAIMVSIMNGQRMGGGFMMAPNSLTNDGLLDICIVDQVSRPQILKLIGSFMKGDQEGKDAIRMIRTSKITVQAVEGILPAHADGETLCVEGKQLEIDLLPSALDIIVPEKNGTNQ